MAFLNNSQLLRVLWLYRISVNSKIICLLFKIASSWPQPGIKHFCRVYINIQIITVSDWPCTLYTLQFLFSINLAIFCFSLHNFSSDLAEYINTDSCLSIAITTLKQSFTLEKYGILAAKVECYEQGHHMSGWDITC